MVMKEIYKTKGKHRSPRAPELPSTVMKKRDRNTERHRGRERGTQNGRGGKEKTFPS